MGVKYENHYGYSNRKKYIVGKGFVDSILPTIKSVGDYIVENKDLLAKPVLASLGSLAATGVAAVGNKIAKKIRGKKVKQQQQQQQQHQQQHQSDDKILDAKGKELIQQILASNQHTGSGIQRF